MKIGFTGTRNGMTAAQKTLITNWLVPLTGVEYVHHGDCVGADADFHSLVSSHKWRTVGHPGPEREMRAFCSFDEEREPKTHFARNRDIVNETDLLIATPRLMFEETCGGTWYTINYARKANKTLLIVWPDGSYQEERAK